MDTSEISLIDLFVTTDHVILSRGQSSVWCCKRSGELLLGSEFDANHVESTSHHGPVWGCIGKIRFFTDGEWKLLLITQATCVGTLPQGGKVYCVDKITIIPLTTEPSVEIVGLEASEKFEKPAVFISLPGLGVELNDMATGSSTGRPSSPTFKEKFMSFVTDSEKPKELKDREKVEKRLTEALLGMFNDSRSFYFSTDFDLTQNLQRKTEQSNNKHLPLWKTVDERFFWNKWMLTDLIENYQGDVSDEWILPIIQGYVEIRQIPITTKDTPDILQPGWNNKYAEKRMSLTSDLDFGLTTLSSSDLALKEQDSLNTIQSELSGSGYETDSESDGDSDQQEDIDKLMMRDMNETDQEVIIERVSEAATQHLDQAREEIPEIKDKRSEKEQDDLIAPEILTSEASKVTIVIDDDCQAEGEKPVPSLSSLCEDLLKDRLGDQTNGLTPNRLRPESDLSNFESDYFASSSARASEEEGWVSVRKEGMLSERSAGEEESPSPTFTLAIVSRRSRHRAGTRYRRRGVDETGNVANNVETEMLVQCGAHVVSYVIVRGSVPVYWTQPGYKYRPLPIIESNDEDTQKAFQKHFDTQLNLYQEMVVVNLVKQSGKEKVLSDAYEKHILEMNNPKITYIVFDFHHHFKTRQSTALKLLLRKTQDITRKMRFCWLDMDQSVSDDNDPSGSVLCRQESVYRVNCMDCLDRTNVTQSVFARDVLQTALQKLGVIPFEERLEGSTLTSFKEMWGNNGDIVSKQYTGTVAMKGDITRYGERKLAGLMKDGYNSAQRYYMNIFRDTYRQVLIDLMQGKSPVEAFSSLPSSMQGTDEMDDMHTELPQVTPTLTAPTFEVGPEEQLPMSVLDKEEAVLDIVQHCKKEVFPNKSLHLQAWALMEAAGHSLVNSSTKEELCILIQCRENSQLTFVSYSMEVEQVVCLLRIPMDNITKIVIGPLGMVQLRSSRRLHMRIYYSFEDITYYLTLRTVSSSPTEDDKAVLLGIADALSFLQPGIQVSEHKLPKKKSPEHYGIVYLMVPNLFVKSLDEQQSNDISSEGHVTCAVTTELPRVPSNESFASDTKYTELESEQSSIGYEKPLNARCRSCDDILSATTLSPTIPMVTVSRPLNPTGSLNIANGLCQSNSDSRLRETIEDSGTMKRASSDTMLSSIEEHTMEERFTKFTGRLLQNLLKVGKSLKQRTSPTKHKITVDDIEPQISETERKETNKDSDSKRPKKLQRFRTKAGSGRSTPQNEPSEEEVVKNEKRAQSKSKIIIV